MQRMPHQLSNIVASWSCYSPALPPPHCRDTFPLTSTDGSVTTASDGAQMPHAIRHNCDAQSGCSGGRCACWPTLGKEGQRPCICYPRLCYSGSGGLRARIGMSCACASVDVCASMDGRGRHIRPWTRRFKSPLPLRKSHLGSR